MAAGGIAVWMRGSDGTSYYFAHLLERAEGLHVGQRVQIGTVLGYVGDTGNAQGGTPHLHFEIHPGGGAPVPPKPTVDAWLDEADRDRTAVGRRRSAPTSSQAATDHRLRAARSRRRTSIETSMLLTLLDPVGGLGGHASEPRGPTRAGAGAVSDRLLAELIRQRVAGPTCSSRPRRSDAGD